MIVEGSAALNGRKQALVGDGLGDFKFIGFEAEWAGHSATAGLNELDRGTGSTEKGDFIGRATEDGLVMAMAVNQDVGACQAASGEAWCALSEPIGRAARFVRSGAWRGDRWEKARATRL